MLKYTEWMRMEDGGRNWGKGRGKRRVCLHYNTVEVIGHLV